MEQPEELQNSLDLTDITEGKSFRFRLHTDKKKKPMIQQITEEDRLINVALERCSVEMSPLETLACFPGQESLSRPPRMDARGRGLKGGVTPFQSLTHFNSKQLNVRKCQHYTWKAPLKQ